MNSFNFRILFALCLLASSLANGAIPKVAESFSFRHLYGIQSCLITNGQKQCPTQNVQAATASVYLRNCVTTNGVDSCMGTTHNDFKENGIAISELITVTHFYSGPSMNEQYSIEVSLTSPSSTEPTIMYLNVNKDRGEYLNSASTIYGPNFLITDAKKQIWSNQAWVTVGGH